MLELKIIVQNARKAGLAIPAFNIPYLPMLDPVVPFQHEQIYTSLVASAGSSSFLTVIPVPRYGHCNFTTQEIAGAFTLLVQQASVQMSP
jgi:hypothetical protein